MSLRHDTREGAVSDALKSGDLLISAFLRFLRTIGSSLYQPTACNHRYRRRLLFGRPNGGLEMVGIEQYMQKEDEANEKL